MHTLIGKLYRLVGRLLMRRDFYVTTCDTCHKINERYFPDHGAFVWERAYWQQFQSDTCCEQTMTIIGHLKGLGIRGALYRLPGYKAHSEESLRRLLRMSSVR